MRKSRKGQDSRQSDLPLLELRGRNGIVKLWPNRVTLTQKGVLGVVISGGSGEKVIPLQNITGIQVKRARFTTGYLKFLILGGQETKAGSIGAVNDQNSILLWKKKDYETAVKIRDKIIELQDDLRAPKPTSMSVADELEKLANLNLKGILSDEEFAAQKLQILKTKQ